MLLCNGIFHGNIVSRATQPSWKFAEIPRDGGGEFQKEAISEGVGACYRGLFPRVLSEIGELSINYSSVEKAISYFTVNRGFKANIIVFH